MVEVEWQHRGGNGNDGSLNAALVGPGVAYPGAGAGGGGWDDVIWRRMMNRAVGTTPFLPLPVCPLLHCNK